MPDISQVSAPGQMPRSINAPTADAAPFQPFQFDQNPLRSFLSFSEIIVSAVAALDNDRGLHGCNQAFARLLREGDGLRLVDDAITTAAQDDADKLTTALSAIVQNGGGLSDSGSRPTHLFSIQRCGRTALHCAVVPVDSLFGGAAVAANVIMFVSDPEQCQPDSIRSICALYQLTPAETQLALYLVQGYNTADIATVMDLKEETIRAYLKHIYTKTDTNRQPELIQLLLASRLPLNIPGEQQPIVSRTRRRH